MKFRQDKPQGKDTDLQLTPMIDVVFQLLIFFLIGTKFRVPEGELEAYLPRDEGPPTELHKPPIDVKEVRITLRVSQRGATDPDAPPVVLLDNTASPGVVEGGGMGWLRARLADISSNDRTVLEKLPIVIEAEPHLAYRWVIETLDICRGIGFRQVNFAASKRNAPLPTGAPRGPGPPP